LASEVTDIPDFSASYSVSLGGIEAGELTRSLTTQTDGKRIFQSETQAKGIFAIFKPEIITETSQWQLNNQYVRPLKYSYVREGGKKDKYMLMNFDWQAKQLHIDDKKRPWSLGLVPKTLDKLVYQIALMLDLQKQQSTFSYQIADGGKIKTYDIIAYGTEKINTAMGEIETIKLKRERSDSKDRQTTLWCAPSLNYLPVQLEHIEKDGTVFIASIKQLDGIDANQAFVQTQVELD
jgi:hypothetical protein